MCIHCGKCIFVALFHFVMLIFAHFFGFLFATFILFYFDRYALNIFFLSVCHRVSNVVRVRILIEFFISLSMKAKVEYANATKRKKCHNPHCPRPSSIVHCPSPIAHQLRFVSLSLPLSLFPSCPPGMLLLAAVTK